MYGDLPPLSEGSLDSECFLIKFIYQEVAKRPSPTLPGPCAKNHNGIPVE